MKIFGSDIQQSIEFGSNLETVLNTAKSAIPSQAVVVSCDIEANVTNYEQIITPVTPAVTGTFGAPDTASVNLVCDGVTYTGDWAGSNGVLSASSASGRTIAGTVDGGGGTFTGTISGTNIDGVGTVSLSHSGNPDYNVTGGNASYDEISNADVNYNWMVSLLYSVTQKKVI